MDANVFLKGWTVGARLRGRSAAPGAGGTGGGSGRYDKASFLAGLAAGFASRGAPPWAYTGERIVADTEYLLPLGAGIPVTLDAVDVGSAEYLLPLGAGLPVELGDVDTGTAEYLMHLGAGTLAQLGLTDAGSAEYLLPLGAGEIVEFEEGTQ